MCKLQQFSFIGDQDPPLLHQHLHHEEDEPLDIIAARLIQIGDQITEEYSLSIINEFTLIFWNVLTIKLKNLTQKFVN